MRSLSELRRGFGAGFPLWPGLVPFALAFAVLARQAGVAPLEVQLMSLVVFAGGAQLTAVGLFAHGAGGVEIVLTTLLLNLRHVLYGLSLSHRGPLRRLGRVVAAHLLTDEAFGLTMSAPSPSSGFFVGVGASAFVSWNLATAVGLWAGPALDPARLSAEFVLPLAFLAMLALAVQSVRQLAVAALASVIALVLGPSVGTGVAVLVAVVAGAAAGAIVGPRAVGEGSR
jgi:4-azaleucine resistance transporter AzlC